MWFLLFGLIALVVAVILSLRFYSVDRDGFLALLIVIPLLLVFGSVAFGAGHGMHRLLGGCYEGYSEGTREGYVTKLSVRGVIWKTNEGEMQIGSGELAALQEPFCFSVPDEEIFRYLTRVTGRRVRLHYVEWLVMPIQIGDSGYEITRIEVLDEGDS